MSVTLHLGDCLEVMAGMEAGSVDAIVTDPPYLLNFMGKEFDSQHRTLAGGGTEGRRAQEWHGRWAAAALRVLKPGGYMLAFGGTRTYHRLACAVEDAGFEIRDSIMCLLWVFGCLSEDTEILTARGWVPNEKLVESDLILAYNVEDDTYGWEPLEGVFRYEYAETAYAIGSADTDQIVSRNHRCLLWDGDGFRFVLAEEAARESEIHVPVLQDVRGLLQALPLPHGGPGQEEQGLFRGVQECFDQSEEDGQEIEARSGLSVVREGVPSEAEIGSSVEQVPLLRLQMCGGGPVQRSDFPWQPETLRSQGTGGLDRGVAELLSGEDERREQPRMEGRGDDLQDARKLCRGTLHSLPASLPGDGPQGWLRDGASSGRCPDHRSLLAEDGSRSPRQSRPDRQSTREPATVREQPGSQTVRASRFTRTTLATIRPVAYRGIVWCVKVPSGAFVARRNGKVFVTGNSGFPKSKACLKPAYEPILLCRKPGPRMLPLGIDACRVPGPSWMFEQGPKTGRIGEGIMGDPAPREGIDQSHPAGRYPPNIVFTHHPECEPCGTRRVRSGNSKATTCQSVGYGGKVGAVIGPHYAGPDGLETVEAWNCVEACPVRRLDEQAGERKSGKIEPHHQRHQASTKNAYGDFEEISRTSYGDVGSASRFFPQFAWEADDFTPYLYCPKASRAERNKGLEGMPTRETSHSAYEPSLNAVIRCADCGRTHALGEKDRSECRRCGGPNLSIGPAAMDGTGRDACKVKVNTHPCVKPISLCRWLVKLVCPPGGTPLDPFAGTGSTLLAALAEGFDAIGIEKDPEYHAIAEARIAAAHAATPLLSGLSD